MNRSLPFLLPAVILLTGHPFVLAQDLDLLIRGGSPIDGSGSPAAKADIGIKDEHIVFVAPARANEPSERSMKPGLIVTPGFIDPQTHIAGGLSDPRHSRSIDAEVAPIPPQTRRANYLC